MTKNKFFFVVALTFFPFLCSYAQVSISGQLIDTAQEKVMAATVMLLNSQDSSLVNYTSSNKDGYFSFNNIKRNNYILKISHVTYMPVSMPIKPSAEQKYINLGVIELKEIANFLMEIVIKEAKAPIFIKGDTVEYDATTFKVPPGSTVEDLLKKLPGIEVDANGAITTMGKDVSSVYVDGKVFFSNDPKTVTQNLDAAAVKKVQVYSEKTEQEKITGLSQGNNDKAVNLQLKDEYKKGYFGKATLGGGVGFIEDNKIYPIWLGSGNFNWFSDKHQLSFIANANNLNQGSYNWNDYMEFKGQSLSFGNDNGDFGFGETSYRRSFMRQYSGSTTGFSQNYGGGVNYNFLDKKIKFNIGYYYTRNNTKSDSFRKRQTFLPDSTYYLYDTTNNKNIRNNHSFETRLQYDADSSNSLVLKASVNLSNYTTASLSNQLYLNSETIRLNLNTVDSKDKNNNLNLSSLALYSHKFQKKGRRFAISASYLLSNDDNIEDINNTNIIYDVAQSPSDLTKLLIVNNKNIQENTIKSSVIYTEPLWKRFTLLGFYNFRNTSGTQNNSFDDKDFGPIDSLSMSYQSNEIFNRAGASLNYNYDGINISAGGAFQSIKLNGHSKTTSSVSTDPRPYNNFVPNVDIGIEFGNGFFFQGNYSYNITAPKISYIFPIPNVSNRLYSTLGNKDLSPEKYHSIDGDLSWWNQADMISISLSANASFYNNQIIYNQTTQFVDTIGYVTVSKPDNVDGGRKYSTNLWTNFPIVKTILSMSISGGYSFDNSPIFINSVENITKSNSVNGRASFNLNIGDKLSFSFGGSVGFTDSKYSIHTQSNQQTMNYSASANGKWQFLKKSFLEVNYSFSNYNNSRLDFDQNINRLNVSIRQVIGKKNQWEMRLSAMDILNQNKDISQYLGSNYVQYTQSPTLARYFLLSVAYNLRGFSLENDRRRGH